MTLAPLLTAGPAIQIYAVAAMAAFALGIVQFAAPKGTIPAVIPGRAEGASPESRTSGFPAFLDSGSAASRRPGMTAEVFSAIC